MNGKGDKLRKGANLALYWENYDKIFRKKKFEEDEEINVMGYGQPFMTYVPDVPSTCCSKDEMPDLQNILTDYCNAQAQKLKDEGLYDEMVKIYQKFGSQNKIFQEK
jgi:hypothetical protein